MNLKYGYPAFVDDLKHIVCALKISTFQPDIIVGLARGGLPAAVCLSHRLDIEMESVNWPREENLRSSCWHIGDYIQEGKQILIVDDIIDSGRSIQSFLDHLQEGQVGDLRRENVRIATLLWYMDSDLYKPDFYGTKLSREQHGFVDFFWEDKT